MTKAKLLKKYSMLPNFAEVAIEGFDEGFNRGVENADPAAKRLRKENEEMKAEINDLRRCLEQSGFYL